MLTILAIGLLPALEAKPKTAMLWILIMNLPYLARVLAIDAYAWQATYWTVALFGAWLWLAHWVWQRDSLPAAASALNMNPRFPEQ